MKCFFIEYLLDLYERKAFRCKQALERYALYLRENGLSLSDSRSIYLSQQYHFWLSALYEINCVSLELGYSDYIKSRSALYLPDVISAQATNAGCYSNSDFFDNEDIIFIRGCMSYEYFL